MFDIVVCSNSLGLISRSIKVVNKALISYEFDYHIHKFTDNCSKLRNIIKNKKRKIYIIDSDMLDIAYKIRENDFASIIIIVSLHAKFDIDLFHEKLLVLDYICLDDDYNDNLVKNIDMCIKILFYGNVFSFKYNYVTYWIPYEEINYIEKESNVKRCIVHTLNKEYYVINSIAGIIKSLDGMFVKSSQSCIINMMNVEYVDCTNNIIYFKNGDMTSLVTNKMKKDISSYVK